jgi:hypothetical protein
MTRFDSALNEAAAARSSVKLFIACDLDFSSGHVRAHDGIGTIAWGGNSYDGLGKFGGIEVAEESIDLIARPVRLSLSGVPEASLPAALVSTALDEVYQGRSAILYLGLADNDTNELVDTPEILWEGMMDQMAVRLSEGSGSISLNCEHRLRRAPRIARYTNEDQQLIYPGDRFFDLVPKIAGYKAKWGARDVAVNIRQPWIDLVGRVADRVRGRP